MSWVWIQGPNDGWIIVDNNVLTKITLLLLFTKTVIKLRTFTKTEKAKYWILEYENTFFYLNSRSPTYVPTSEPIGRCQIWRNSLQIKNFLRAKIGLIGRCMGWSWHSQCQSQKNQVTYNCVFCNCADTIIFLVDWYAKLKHSDWLLNQSDSNISA